MKNYGILVATSKGIFYINGWILLLAFDRTAANDYLSKLPNVQVQYTKLGIDNISEELKNARYNFEEEQLSIEFSQYFVTFDFEFSPFDPKKCNRVKAKRIDKHNNYNLKLFSKEKNLYLGKESHCLKFFKISSNHSKKDSASDPSKNFRK